MKHEGREELRAKVEALAAQWKADARQAKIYAAYPKSAGIDVGGALMRYAHLDVSADALLRLLEETTDGK